MVTDELHLPDEIGNHSKDQRRKGSAQELLNPIDRLSTKGYIFDNVGTYRNLAQIMHYLQKSVNFVKIYLQKNVIFRLLLHFLWYAE